MHRKVKVFLFGNPWILCHEIYQNSNSKIALNIKMTTQSDKTRCKQHRKYKGDTDGQTCIGLKRIAIVVFKNLLA